MISDEKIIHIVHLMLDGLENGGMVEYVDKDKATREAKKVCLKFVSHMNAARDVAKGLISSQKNGPPEGSSQWNALFWKFYEEELRKRGG